MATVAIPAPRRRPPSGGAGGDAMPSLWPEADCDAPVDAVSLDDRISGLWEGLVGSAAVSCPLCDAEMSPRWSAGAGVVGGRCEGCGATLE